MAHYDAVVSLKLLQLTAQQRLVFSFNQANDWWNIALFHGGACDGITLDWLRRKFFAKRSLGDKKYESAWVLWNSADRQKLGRKHVLMSTLFRAAFQKATQGKNLLQLGDGRWAPGAFADFVKTYHGDAARQARKDAKEEDAGQSGFERMAMSCPGWAPGLHVAPAREEACKEMLKLLDPAPAGCMLNWTGGKEESGHAVGVFRRDGHYDFFDPNLGEYSFGGADEVVSFVCALWRLQYNSYDFLKPYIFTRAAVI